MELLRWEMLTATYRVIVHLVRKETYACIVFRKVWIQPHQRAFHSGAMATFAMGPQMREHRNIPHNRSRRDADGDRYS